MKRKILLIIFIISCEWPQSVDEFTFRCESNNDCIKGYICHPVEKICVKTEKECIPNCKDKECGDDGCGGSCGTCYNGKICINGKCIICEVWDKTYGGSDDDRARSIQQTNDGGYIVAGGTFSKGAGWYDFWVIKLDKNGNYKCE